MSRQTLPVLPVEAVRAAISDGDWPAAVALLGDHDFAVRAAFSVDDGNGNAVDNPAPWRQLLQAQRALIAELVAARDDTAHTLQRMGSDRRVVNAYLGGAYAGGGAR